jgi:hypothetical protein
VKAAPRQRMEAMRRMSRSTRMDPVVSPNPTQGRKPTTRPSAEQALGFWTQWLARWRMWRTMCTRLLALL